MEENEQVAPFGEMPYENGAIREEKPKRKFNWMKFVFMSLSYLLVIAITVVITLSLFGPRYSKLTELEMVIDQVFVGDYDKAAIEDAAARAMVAATGDRWSFYLTAEEWADYKASLSNSFVGFYKGIHNSVNGTAF